MSAALHKRAAAEAAVSLVEDGMLVGLGTGSTAAIAIELLIERARAGLSITCVPTSKESHRQAEAGGLVVLAAPPADRLIDLTIDGADEVELGTLNLIKGLGGALLWEKIVAAASRRLVIIGDDSKVVSSLGGRPKVPLPVEVVPFGWERTARRIADLGVRPVIRRRADGAPFQTDSCHLILDCHAESGTDMAALERSLAATVGVVESGLFIGMASLALIAGDQGVTTYRRDGSPR